MENINIAILGGGNLGGAIAEGLVKSAYIKPANLWVTRRKLHLIQHLKDLGIQVTSDNKEAVKQANIIIVAVKPKRINEVLEEIGLVLDGSKHTLVSVATGVSTHDIKDVVGDNIPIILAMPNTAIAIQQSMTCLASQNAGGEQMQTILSLFEQLGKAVVIDEELMEASTVLGACGVAYALRFIRAASQGGIEIGFDSATAQLIAAQTVKGSATLLLENGQHPEHEIDKVTTPQGCTIAGLNEMEHQGFSSALIKGIITSFKKIAKIPH